MLICLSVAAIGGSIIASAQSTGKKVVIPFDFESKFDEGRYGEMVGDMIWKKLEKERFFVVPETMGDVRDFCKTNSVKVTGSASIEQVKKIVREDFDAQIGIWGSVELAPGAAGEIYDLMIKCVDFSEDPPKTIYECKNRTNSVSEIPHLYVKAMIDAMCQRKPGEKPGTDPVEEEFWEKNPNLVKGGDFEKASNGVPVGWEDRAGQKREPLGNLVKWMPEAGSSGGNHVVRFTLDKGVAESTGVMWYSKPFPLQEGAKYRFQCRYRTNGPSPKVFIKCYDEIPSEWYKENEVPKSAGDRPASEPAVKWRNTYKPEHTESREVYRSQQNLKGPKNQWNTQTEDFTPKHTKYTPRFGRVMLYAYLSPGVMEWDDVVVKMIMPGSASDTKKEKRHSLETKVTIKEMEENVRRSNELKDKQRVDRVGTPQKDK